MATSPMLISGIWNVVQASEKLIFKYLILTKLTQVQVSSGYYTGQHHPIPFTHWFLVVQLLCVLVSSPLKIIPHRTVKGIEQVKPWKGLGSVWETWDIPLQYLFTSPSPMFTQLSPLSDSYCDHSFKKKKKKLLTSYSF